MRRHVVVAIAAVVCLPGCGGLSAHTLTIEAVTKSFATEGINLHALQPSPAAPAATLLPRSTASASSFVVWVYPNDSAAKAAAARRSESLSAATRQWEKLTGKRVALSRDVERVSNVVVLRGNVQAPVRQITAALTRLSGS